MTKKNIKKILIIRFSSIGDIVLTTPVVRCVKKQLSAEVHFLTKKSFQSLLSNNPFVDKIFAIEKKVSEVLPQLKLEKYDAVIDLHKNLRSQQVRWALGVPYFTFDKLNWEKWLMVNFKINRLPKIHIVERYMKAVEDLGVTYDNQGLQPPRLEPPTPKGEYRFQYRDVSDDIDDDGVFGKDKTDDFLENGAEVSKVLYPYGKRYSPLGVGGFRDVLVFAIGGAHATKRLPIEKIIEICRGINSPIILLGGKEDATIGEKIVLSLQKEGNEGRVINLCGKTTLDESAQIIQHARKVITHDTGMMHIAAAFQKEIISIWGNTIPEFGMHPFYKKGVNNNVSVEVKNLSCRPCSKIGFDECPKGHFKCMMEIDVQRIIDLAGEEE